MTAPTEQTDPGDRKVSERAKVATAWVFVLAGAAFASWASRIPDVRHSLGLAPGQLGLLLLVGSCGSLVGLPLAGWVAARIGTRRTVLLGASLAMVGLTGAGVSAGPLHSFWLTAACLFVTLAGIGQWDVAMNIEGAQVELHLAGRMRTVHDRQDAGCPCALADLGHGEDHGRRAGDVADEDDPRGRRDSRPEILHERLR